MSLKAFRLIEDGRSPEASAEQALRVARPAPVFSYTTSSASLLLKGSVRRTSRMHQCPILGKKHAQPPHFSRNIKLYLELAGILALCALL